MLVHRANQPRVGPPSGRRWQRIIYFSDSAAGTRSVSGSSLLGDSGSNEIDDLMDKVHRRRLRVVFDQGPGPAS
jgi:hypothetical protein